MISSTRTDGFIALCLLLKIMCLVVLLLSVCLFGVLKVNCEYSNTFTKDKNTLINVKRLQKRSLRQYGVVFCDISCVLYDPDHPPLIDDPGRNFYDTFSVISTSYVIEVVGDPHGLSRHPLRVMLSDKVLGSKHWRTSAVLQGNLILQEGEMIQRITFNLDTSIAVTADSEAPEELVVKIPHVVPHVIFLHNYKFSHRGEKESGVVTIEACDFPMTLELVVARSEDGICWMKPLDRSQFENYMIAVRVRGNDRHVIGMVFAKVQAYLEDHFPFGVYMDEINEFTFRFLEESLQQKKRVTKENKRFIDLCKTISRHPPDPESSTVSETHPKTEGDCNETPISVDIEFRSKHNSSAGDYTVHVYDKHAKLEVEHGRNNESHRK